MDPALIELLRNGKPRDEVAVLLRLAPGAEPAGARIVSRLGSIVTARMARRMIPRIHGEAGVQSMKAPRLYSPDWIIAQQPSESTTDRGPTDDRRPQGLPQTGRGVITALIDWGLDVAHPDFRNRDGTSRVLAFWDQRRRADGRCNNKYGYGWIHNSHAIDDALRQSDPYSAMQYRPSDTSKGPTHGTHTAGILCGNGRGGGPVGMAPEAQIIFVHLADPVEACDNNLGNSVALQEGIDFVAKVAGKRPWVLNLSMGRHAGPHDGTTLIEQGIDAALSISGRACVQSTGNYLTRPIHTQGQLRPGELREIAFHTGEEDGYAHEIDIWYAGRDRISIEILAPSGAFAGCVATGEECRLVVDGQNVGRIYNRRRDPNNHDNEALVLLDAGAVRGSWTLRLRALDVVDGRYHCWVERDPGCSACQPSFEASDVVTSSTTGTICNGFLTVAVGSYNAHEPDRPLASFSSAGPTRDGRMKPDLLAPGVDVLSSRSAPHYAGANDERDVRMSGTSMSSPSVAGTVALMFEAAGRPLPVRETREMLLRTAEPCAGKEQPMRWGSGYLAIEAAIAAASERTVLSQLRSSQWQRDSKLQEHGSTRP